MNKKILLSLLLIFNLTYVFLLYSRKKEPILEIQTDPVPVQYVGKVSFDNISIRMLILKHTFEKMANDDADLAIAAINLAANKGLTIKDIGEFNINQNGKIDSRTIYTVIANEKIKEFVSEQMKVNAKSGDTLVVFTIGHGAPTGNLDTLGQRQEIMTAISQAAAENNQETVWWQLSCFASAKLPKVTELSIKEQSLFSVVASSDAKTESPAYVEGKIMQKVFVAMAEKDQAIDPDGNQIVVAEELANFLDKIETGRGQRVYARSPQEPVFGLSSEAWLAPIVDRNNPQQQYPFDYIPLPQKSISPF